MFRLTIYNSNGDLILEEFGNDYYKIEKLFNECKQSTNEEYHMVRMQSGKGTLMQTTR